MFLTKDQLKEYRVIYKKLYNKDISNEEVYSQSVDLINFMKLARKERDK